MASIRVTHVDGDRFEVALRGHTLTVDQPVSEGGTDAGPAPVELLVTSLAACVAHYARRYLARHDLPVQPLVVVASYEIAAGPARVADIDVALTVSEEIPPARRAALHAVVSRCTVHNTFTHPPRIAVRIVDAASAAA